MIALPRSALVTVCVAALLGIFGALCLDLARRTSATFDEPRHLGEGASYWANGDYRLATGDLLFAQRFAGLGPWLAGYEFPTKQRQAAWGNYPDTIGSEFLYHMGHDPVRLLATGRVMIIFLGLALGLVVFLWGRRIFGNLGGLVALALFVFCPPLVGNASLVTTDIATTLWFTVAWAAYWHLLQVPRLACAVAAGLALGLLLLTKASSVGFFAVAGCLLAWSVWRGVQPLSWPRLGRLHAVAGLVAWLTIWAFFGFTTNPGQFSFPWKELGPGTIVYQATAALRRFHLLPDPFIYELAGLRHLVVKRYSFFAGEHFYGGSRGFFPAALLFKTPPATLVAVLLAAAVSSVALWRNRRPPARNAGLGWPGAASAPLWIIVIVYAALCIASGVNIGHRHLLPIYPALLMLGGGALAWLARRHRTGAALAAALLACSVIEAAWFHGRELAYFSSLAGGPTQGYRWFIDSTTDWGANLPELAAWQRDVTARAPDTSFFVGHLGVEEIAAYGVRGVLLSTNTDPFRLHGGTYVLSASALYMGYVFQPGPYTEAHEARYQVLLAGLRAPVPGSRSPAPLAWRKLALGRLSAFCRHRAPDARVGDVYFVFQLSDAEVTQALFGALPSGVPEPPQHVR